MSTSDIYFGFSLVGLIFGLGAALVILFLGLLSLKSNYWFRTLNGVDKITIPMLWFGASLLSIALILHSSIEDSLFVPFWINAVLLILMTLNGVYLTFVFAPIIRKQENNPKMTFLTLPMPHQILIFIAGGISALSWTSHAVILWLEIVNR